MKAKMLLLTASFVALVCFSPAAHAALSIVSVLGGNPETGANYVTFNTLGTGLLGAPVFTPNTALSASPGPANGIYVSGNPDGSVVNGPASGLYAPPVLSGTNGNAFDSQPNGVDTTNYITSGAVPSPGAEAVLTLPNNQLYFGLLWGSIDDYNTLSFYNGATLVGSITGAQVLANPNGDQGVNGTHYVNINSDTFFNTVVATSSLYAFEFDNVAYSAIPVGSGGGPVPEPASMIVWSLIGLTVGAATWQRRKR